MTTPDFQTQLRLQLREAARREERRSRLALPTGWWRGFSPVLAAAAITLLVVALVLAGLALRGPNPDRTATPRAVERLPLSGSLSDVVSAFGSVWAVDPTGRLLQVDPVSRDVLSSHLVPSRTRVAAAGGSLWVGGESTLIRIDPKSGREVARIPWRTPRGDTFDASYLEDAGAYVWLIGIEGLLRIDLKRNVPDRFVPVEAGGLIRGSVVQNGSLFVIGRDGRLLRFDARTGARLGATRVNWPAQAGLAADHGVALTWTLLDGRVARVDLATGRELWVRNVGGRPGWWTVSGQDVWVHVSTGHGRDHLLRLDARTGRVVGKVQLPDLGVTTMAAINGQIWVGTPNGTIDIVRVAPR
jgi:outer membrane protein assembly factor BamB